MNHSDPPNPPRPAWGVVENSPQAHQRANGFAAKKRWDVRSLPGPHSLDNAFPHHQSLGRQPHLTPSHYGCRLHPVIPQLAQKGGASASKVRFSKKNIVRSQSPREGHQNRHRACSAFSRTSANHNKYSVFLGSNKNSIHTVTRGVVITSIPLTHRSVVSMRQKPPRNGWMCCNSFAVLLKLRLGNFRNDFNSEYKSLSFGKVLGAVCSLINAQAAGDVATLMRVNPLST